jgi:hypothetical protein
MDDIQKLNEKISSLEKRILVLEGNSNPALTKSVSDKKLSVREFVITKNPTDDVEKTLAIASYLEKYEGLSSFNTKDLERGFQLAKEATPTNINDKINKNIRKGHIAEAGEKKDNKKAWIVTNSGEKFLNGGFDSTNK